MAHEAQHQPTTQPDLYAAAEAVVQSGRTQRVTYKGATLTIGRLRSAKSQPPTGAETLTPAERENILRSTFGAWKGHVDGAQLKRDLRELQRDESDPRSL